MLYFHPGRETARPETLWQACSSALESAMKRVFICHSLKRIPLNGTSPETLTVYVLKKQSTIWMGVFACWIAFPCLKHNLFIQKRSCIFINQTTVILNLVTNAWLFFLNCNCEIPFYDPGAESLTNKPCHESLLALLFLLLMNQALASTVTLITATSDRCCLFVHL